MVKGEFVKSMGALLEQTPATVRGGVEVDQVYAHYQHAHPEFHHPRGGQAFYLSEPLFANAAKYLKRIADAAIGADGVDLVNPMARSMESLSQEVHKHAPVEFEHLRNSGHPTVRTDGVLAYDRPPLVRRLSEDELRAISKLQYLHRRR